MKLKPFDDFRALCTQFPAADVGTLTIAQKWQEEACKPVNSLGKLEELAIWYASWQGIYKPVIKKPILALFASTHGVCSKEATGLPLDMTQKLINNFAVGRAAINQICFVNNLGLKLFDLALDYPTMDITQDAAMDERSAAATMAFGMEAIAGDIDLLALGQMSAGNELITAAICTALFGEPVEDWLSMQGKDKDLYKKQVDLINKALLRHEDKLSDPLEVMRCLGGREIAALVGALLASRMQKIPVILDGFVTTTAASILFKMNPDALSHCVVGHVSAHPGHKKLLQKLNKDPILDLSISLEDGVGAALASNIVRSAVLAHTEMGRFADLEKLPKA